MKWCRKSENLAISDSNPTYKVAKFVDADGAQYRASVGGEFIGMVCVSAKEAQGICDRHLMLSGGNKAVA